MAEFDGSSHSPTRSETTNLDDTVDSGNNSIIGRVKSRVSSILPNTFTKWFSPSVKSSNETPQNGSMINADSAIGSRRRRHEELEDDEDDDDDDGEGVVDDEEAALADNIAEHDLDGEEQTRGEYDINLMRSVSVTRRNVTLEDDNEDDDEDEVEEQVNNAPTLRNRSPHNRHENNYNVNLSKSTKQPPIKRVKISDDQLSMRDSPVMPHRPLVASTPAVSTYLRSSAINQPSATRTQTNRSVYMNLYRNMSKRESPYNFSAAIAEPALATSGDLPAVVDANIGVNKVGISSRRSLNIPLLSSHNYLPNLRRQALTAVKNTGTSTSLGTTPLRTSTVIHDTVDERDESLDYENGPTTNINNNNTINDKLDADARQKLVNGVVGGIPSDVVPIDTASEASNEDIQNNMSASSRLNKDNSSRSRTSSVDNMLNFYSHLNGRKSLFTGPQQINQQHRQTGLESMSGIYNSTLSLNSLNRRQFNASIYASTSALSDSRLLNTFSPFYKGRTTYGGASAYNKYNTTLSAAGITGVTGAGTSFMRMKPTVIRPTSSLSTRSSSSNSLGNVGGAGGNGEITGMSDTAQRILALINDFSTPLLDAKRMGNNLREHQQLAKLNRLKDSDLQTSRSTRSPRFTPYTRSTVPSKSTSYMGMLQNGLNTTPQLPTRELIVPNMAQLMKLRDFHNTTGRLRRIAMANPISDERYGEPTTSKYSKIQMNVSDEQQQKHIGKMRQKISSHARITSCKDNALEEEQLPQVPLPTLTFPMMQSVPQFDIKLAKHVPTTMSTKGNISASSSTMTKSTTSTPPITNFAFNDKFTKTNSSLDQTDQFGILNSKFKFSTPIKYSPQWKSLPTTETDFKFSAPEYFGDVKVNASTSSPIQKSATQLRSGSVLDALMPKRKLEDSKNVGLTANSNSFGAQFKKSASEWECDACMLRNKQDASKCIACETPRVSTNANAKPSMLPPGANIANTNTIMSSSFGNKFKKSSAEWDCDACMLRNKQEANKCIACETPRKGESCSAPLTSNVPINANSFGNTFKPKADTWECSVCLVVNKNTNLECIACQSTKPGATAANADISSSLTKEAPKFKFGFAAVNLTSTDIKSSVGANTTGMSPKSDNVFKMLADAQKTSKWSCSACFAQNDAGRTKCVCCEEPKPDTLATTNKSGPTFSFGQSVANTENKFDFVKSDNNVLNKTSTANAAVSSTTTAATFGFQFGSSKPLTTTTTSGADSTDAANKIPETTGFKFASSSSSSSNSSSSQNTTNNKTEEKSPKVVTFNLPTNKATVVTSTVIDVKSNDTNKPTFGGFSFGMPTAVSTATNINLPTATTTASNDMPKPAIPTLGGFAFSTSTSTSTTASATASANTNIPISTSTISFGSAVTPAPVSLFSFGSPSKLGAAAPGNVINTPSKLTSTMAFGPFTTTTNTTANTSTAPPTIGATKLFGTITPSFSNNIATTTGTTEAAGATTIIAPKSTNSFIFGQQPTVGGVSTTASSSSTSTTSTQATANKFIFGQPPTPAASNPVTSIFSVNNATSSAAPPSNNFVFGSAGVAATPTNTIIDAAKPAEKSNLQTSTSQTFGAAFGTKPESSSSFGPTGAAAKTAVTSTAVGGTVFGSFGGGTSTPTFGSVAPSTNPIFGSGSAPASTVSSSSEATGVFGSFGNRAAVAPTNMFSTNNAAQPTSTFGGFAAAGTNSGAEQSTGSAAAAQTTFGSFAAASAKNAAAPAPMPTFGGFGAAAANAAPTAAIKPAFNFGGGATIQNPSSSVGVFSFGSNAAVAANNATTKPTFNFTATNPTANFNFTNSAAVNSSTSTDQAANRPFQFGSVLTPAAAPMSMNMFSFGAGGPVPHAEATTNTSAPFQFNAGAAAPANIFAINPATTSGNNAQNVQQARRKIRAPTRRLTPR